MTISEWKSVASDRPTVVFCPSVKYAHWAADLWRQAGYTAAAIDCNTDQDVRDSHIAEIKSGNIQVTCNFGIYTHGTDVPEWSCVVIMRPTESTGLLMQMLGRGTRPDDRIAHVLGTLATPEERKTLIANSCKPDVIIIDVVDIVGRHKIATLPTALGLPPKLNLQGKKLTEAADMVEKFESVKSKAIMECPATYEELSAALVRIDILEGSGSKSRNRWKVAEDGSYWHGKLPVGFKAMLERNGETWTMRVVDLMTGEIIREAARERREGELSAYFDSADAAVMRAIEHHRKEHPRATGMLARLIAADALGTQEGRRDTRLFYLRRAGCSDAFIDTMSHKQVIAIVQKERDKYWQAKNIPKKGQDNEHSSMARAG